MLEKIFELQKLGLSKKAIFEKLKSDTFDDVFLSKKLVHLPESETKKKYSWIYSFYVSILFLKMGMFLLVKFNFPFENWHYVFDVKDLVLVYFLCSFYLWKNWHQVFFLMSLFINIILISVIRKDGLFFLSDSIVYGILCADGFFNYYLGRRIHGRVWPKKFEKDPLTGIYKF